jgi:hypothetical protein
MGFIVGVPPGRGHPKIKWYAVLHTFDSQGRHLHTEALFLSAGDLLTATGLGKAEAKLKRRIDKLGRCAFGDIEVSLFKAYIDGHLFGLVDASETDEGYQRVDLLPNGLAFFPPWDGTYST